MARPLPPPSDDLRVIIATTLINFLSKPPLRRVALGELSLSGKVSALANAVEIIEDLAKAGYRITPERKVSSYHQGFLDGWGAKENA